MLAHDRQPLNSNPRAVVRPRHLERAHQFHRQGVIREGGALLSAAPTTEDPNAKMLGSTFLLEMPSRQACIEWLRQDPYYTDGVWDPERIEIYPVRLASLAAKK